MTNDLRLFSVDDHIIEPPNVWQDRVPNRFKEQAPHVITEGNEEYWVYEDQRGLTLGLNAVAGKPFKEFAHDPLRYDDMIPGCYDPKERAKDMLSNGIYASLLFPTLPRFGGALFLTFKDKELAKVCVEAYNDFLLDEWCPAGPPGLYVPAVIVPLWDAQLAVAEIHRCADKGAHAVLLPENTVPLDAPSYWNTFWNPVWQACQDRNLPICMHIASSGWLPTPTPPPDAPIALTFALNQVSTIMAAVNLLMSPVFRLYPDLKIVMSEGGIGWVPNALERADRMWERHAGHSKLEGISPSEVFRRNMYLCMIEEPICLKYRYDIGVDRIMWECDYPHSDTVWPDSQKSARAEFDQAGVPDDEVEAITHLNAERVFNWTMASPETVH